MGGLDGSVVGVDSSEDGSDETLLGVLCVLKVSEEAHDLVLGASLVEGELHILVSVVGGEVSHVVDVDLAAFDDLAVGGIGNLIAFLAALVSDGDPRLSGVLIKCSRVSLHVTEGADSGSLSEEIAGQERDGVD